MKIIQVILCGGAGTRLWPQSSGNLQKQFIDGKKPAGCMRCWKEEDAGIKSKRQLDYERFQDDFDKVDLKRTEFKNIELNFCTTGPHQTMWGEE